MTAQHTMIQHSTEYTMHTTANNAMHTTVQHCILHKRKAQQEQYSQVYKHTVQNCITAKISKTCNSTEMLTTLHNTTITTVLQ